MAFSHLIFFTTPVDPPNARVYLAPCSNFLCKGIENGDLFTSKDLHIGPNGLTRLAKHHQRSPDLSCALTPCHTHFHTCSQPPSAEPGSPGRHPPIRRTCSEASHVTGALPGVRMPLHVGVLHYSPSYDVFPLLADPSRCDALSAQSSEEGNIRVLPECSWRAITSDETLKKDASEAL
eukprot:881020-Pelagomonas_calceolata.AAC.11